MIPDADLKNIHLIVVTGSNMQAERHDRPLAYRLQNEIEQFHDPSFSDKSIVISDLWYLNCELLHHLPMIAIGGPEVNAVSAWLHKRIGVVLQIDNCLTIQMDVDLSDLRACVWGYRPKWTAEAIDLFIDRGYLSRFLESAQAHQR